MLQGKTALAVFLAGDAAASIIGTVLPIDGGWTRTLTFFNPRRL